MFARKDVSTGRTVVIAVTSFARWFGRHCRALGFNPLVRASDRIEALAVLAVFGATLFAIPIAAHAGSLIYDANVRTANEQAHSRHSVDATVIERSTSLPADFDSPDYVRAQWRDGTRLRTEQVLTPAIVRAGEPLKVWLDDAGKVVAAPLTAEDASLSAGVAAGSVWVVVVVCSALAALVIRLGLDRSRDRAWDRELRLLAHNDDGWANRRT